MRHSAMDDIQRERNLTQVLGKSVVEQTLQWLVARRRPDKQDCTPTRPVAFGIADVIGDYTDKSGPTRSFACALLRLAAQVHSKDEYTHIDSRLESTTSFLCG